MAPPFALDDALVDRGSAKFIQQRDGGDQTVIDRLDPGLRRRVR